MTKRRLTLMPLLFFCTSYLFAQDLSGLWQGVSYVDRANPRYYIFVLNLTQTGNIISGTSEVREVGTNYGGIQRVAGSVSNNVLTIKDVEVLEKTLPARDTGLCWRSGTLTFEPTRERLSGLLSSTCGDIRAELYRLKIFTDTIICNPKNVSIRATGQNLRWYQDSLKQTLIYAGDAINPSVTRDTTFYVTQTLYNTESPVVPITIRIKNYNQSQRFKLCEGQSVAVGDTVYKTSGVYTKRLASINGCDSLITTNLVVNTSPKIQNTLSLCVGETVTVGDTTYKTSGIYNKKFKTTEGCDSIITTNLTVSSLKTYNQILKICEGEKVTVGDTTYRTTGQYTKRFTAASGCDSLVTTDLTVNAMQKTIRTLTICEGETVTVGDTIYKTSGNYIKKLKTTEGCDSLVTTNLIVNLIKNSNQNITLCEGETVAVGDTIYRTTGKYLKRLRSINGCDSLVSTNLVVYISPKKTQNLTICEGESISVGDTTYKTSGVYTKRYKTVNGCDSLIMTNLTVNPIKKTNQDLRLCNGKTITVGDTIYRTDGIYLKKLRTYAGCDSLVTTNLKIINEVKFSQKLTICAGLTVSVGDTTYRTSGIYSKKLRSTEGCDSIVTTDLAVVKLDLQVSHDTLLNLGDSVQLSASINLPLSVAWKWSPNIYIKCDTCPTTWVKPNNSTQYQIEVYEKDSKCRKTGNVFIKTKSDCALFVPTAFSPNGDNMNDTWTIYPSNCVKTIKRIAVFNRWGNLILEKNNLTVSLNQGIDIWDGLINGRPIETDTFVYVIEAEYSNGERGVIGGDFTVMR